MPATGRHARIHTEITEQPSFFHNIVIYNPWTWKQSEYSLKISLTAKRSEFTDVQKLFLLRRDIEDKIDHYVSYRVFFLFEATKDAED